MRNERLTERWKSKSREERIVTTGNRGLGCSKPHVGIDREGGTVTLTQLSSSAWPPYTFCIMYVDLLTPCGFACIGRDKVSPVLHDSVVLHPFAVRRNARCNCKLRRYRCGINFLCLILRHIFEDCDWIRHVPWKRNIINETLVLLFCKENSCSLINLNC